MMSVACHQKGSLHYLKQFYIIFSHSLSLVFVTARSCVFCCCSGSAFMFVCIEGKSGLLLLFCEALCVTLVV